VNCSHQNANLILVRSRLCNRARFHSSRKKAPNSCREKAPAGSCQLAERAPAGSGQVHPTARTHLRARHRRAAKVNCSHQNANLILVRSRLCNRARFHSSRKKAPNSCREKAPAGSCQFAEKAPAGSGQVHPTARSLSSHRVLFVQLNSELQLLSTVSEPKTGRHPCPAPTWQTGPGLQGSTSSHSENDQTALQHAGKNPGYTRPGSPHSKKLRLTPCAVVQLNSELRLLSTVSEPKTGRHPLIPARSFEGAPLQPCHEHREWTGALAPGE
jgi:hypothetical protein